MKKENKIVPPRWAERLLEWYCRPEILEDLQGDLNEYFDRNIRSKGKNKARLIYIIDVFKFMRTYTIRKPEFLNLLINWIMLGSYIKTSGRSLVRNKLFSTINIVGLAISMSVGLIMISVLSDVQSYDKFHSNHARIYRVNSGYQYLDRKDEDYLATTSLKAAKAIEENFAGPEAVAIIRREFSEDVTADGKTVPLSGYWANEGVFRVFSFQMITGNPATALKTPFSIVLTESAAIKLFGNDEAVGKALTTGENKSYTVTGIIKDLPKFSTIRFEALTSLSTRPVLVKEDEKRAKTEMQWDNVWNTWVYLLLPENVDMKALQSNLDQLSAKEDPTVKNTHIELKLQPFDEIMFTDDLSNEIAPTMGSQALWIFGGLSIVVILSACFNYANLSIARSIRRAREVGIRKVIGALKGQVVSQFIAEAVLISVFSLIVAFVLFLFLREYFLGIDPGFSKMLSLELSGRVVLLFVTFAVLVGVFAGVFPATFFARVNTAQVLKNMSSVLQFKKLTFRKVLIVFQYTISIIFITCTIVIFAQYKHFMNFDLGFSTENVLNIRLQGNKPELLKKDLAELPEVKAISQSQLITSIGNYWGAQMKYHASPNDSAFIYYNTVDENYLPLHGHKLLAGKNFSGRAGEGDETEVIVNEQVLKRFNIAGRDPQKALDEMITVDHKDMRIIGVLKDYHYGRANDKNEAREVVIRYSNSKANILNLKIESSDILDTRSKIEAIWKKHDNIHPIDAKFYSEDLEEAYNGLSATMKMAGFLAMLAVCIASMGLMGMVVFSTETRLREVSIRKVMGASDAGLVFLLGKGFVILLVIATAIAIPATVIFFEQILFPEIANHAPLSIPEMMAGVLVVLLVAIIMIGTQTLKVARANPAQVLKSE